MLGRVNRLLHRTGYALERADTLAALHRQALWSEWMGHLAVHRPDSELPRAQLGQDLLALELSSYKRDGYFVEFGAGDGLRLSNTALLERSFGWTGILVEPARVAHAALRQNRSCVIDTRCVWSASGEKISFTETEDSDYSAVETLIAADLHAERRQGSVVDRYEVETVSLTDLLDEHDAPPVIDYLSIDAEGAEWEILNAFDFSRTVRIISVEHNYEKETRSRIHALLADRRFEQFLPWASQWDDWYVISQRSP